MRVSRRRVQLLLATAMICQLAAGPALAQAEGSDPWEGFNRKSYGIQHVLDRAIFGPLARGFGKTPSTIRKVLTNFSRNLSEPLVFVNDVLQGRPKAAAGTLGRFVMNSTLGVAGIADPARHNHLPHHDNSFGTTLGRWGAAPGPYIFLPVMGPSDVRDSLGSVVDIFLNPFYYTRFHGKTALTVTTGLINGLNTRLQADPALSNIEATSTDPYATLRSYFLQNRQAEIRGETAEPEALPDFDMPADTTGAAPATTPEGAAAPPGAPPAVSQPPSAGGGPPLSGEAGALPRPEATPEGQPKPPADPSAGGAGPRWLVEPDAPLRTAGGK